MESFDDLWQGNIDGLQQGVYGTVHVAALGTVASYSLMLATPQPVGECIF